jgi:MoaA/NifB/PqqE/SkfB family radical SAM enzyme
MTPARHMQNTEQRFDFGSILFAGPCNQRCPYCIGRRLPANLLRPNLHDFPLRSLDAFVAMLRQHSIHQITFTGTNTDPQLYDHEARLIGWLRSELPSTRLSVHTNGQLTLAKIDVFNMYDRATISFPSFDRSTYFKMTGTRQIPDLEAICARSEIPIKLSCVIDEANADQVDEYISCCRAIGIRRVAFRQLYGDNRNWHILSHEIPTHTYRNNPVYDLNGMEITYWHFEHTTTTSLNLFSDGTISTEYLLPRTSGLHLQGTFAKTAVLGYTRQLMENMVTMSATYNRRRA